MVLIYYYYFLFLFLFSLILPNCSIASEIKFHTLNITQHLLLPNCINSSTDTTAATSNSKDDSTTLEVVHRQGLCDYQTQNHPDATSLAKEILRMDQLRVKSIHHKINTSATKLHNHAATHDDISVQPGRAFSTDNYIVSIGLGTPANNLHLAFDTGSEVTWTQCQPCSQNCYKQNDLIFNPPRSTSYSNIPCRAPECRALPQHGCSYRGAMCEYDMQYGDGSYTNGFLAKDKLTVTRNDVFPSFIFGCGQNNQGLFGKTAGIFGLDRGKLSFVSQTSKKYGKYFSYRLPSNPSSTGHLTFGKNSMNSKGVKFTPLINNGVPKEYADFYCIHIISIRVGKTLLPIQPSVFRRDHPTVIDSGTVITRLPQDAYNAMSKEFKRQMNQMRYTPAPAVSILDTCYNVPTIIEISVPPISFTFEGNVRVDLDISGIVYVVDPGKVCLAFAGNTNPDDPTIFGNTQQKNIEVVYDVAGNKLGFKGR